MKNIAKILFALILAFSWGCDKDDFAELNTDPSVISNPDLRFSAAKAIEAMYNNDYTNWFYDNFQYIYPWTQVTTTQGGNGHQFNIMGAWGGGQGLYRDLMRQTRDIQFQVDNMGEEEASKYMAIKAISYPIQIQPAITKTDLFGSIYYSEAAMGPFTQLMTPKMDSQEELFDLWLEELDWAIGVLQNTEGQFELGSQDLIYVGDYGKWAKFCNLLKLKIAARLVHANPSKAIAVAQEVANSPVGYMDELSDDFVYHRGTKWYGTGNPMWIGYGNQELLEFLVGNQDPRVRFHFEKNSFNGEVVQAFIDGGVELPPYVAPFVELDGEGDFAGWSGPGEPWVRYHGAPLSPDAMNEGANDIYFNQADRFKVVDGDYEKSYAGTSLFNQKIVRTSYDFTYPTKPGGRVIELKENPPGLQVVLGSSAETNLYFAEFKLLGANLPKTAQEYFNKGVELSVRRADALAANNQLPYYEKDPVYPEELQEAAGVKLKAGEIEALLEQPVCDLTIDGLEKVYLQQYINFMNTPGDLWATVRRSGVPKRNSDYLSWQPVLSSGVDMVMPRRFVVQAATVDDLNYDNAKAGIDAQGFTTGVSDPQKLNTERLWFDKNSPDYGEGPNN